LVAYTFSEDQVRERLHDLPGEAATGRGSESARKALEKQRRAKPTPPEPENPENFRDSPTGNKTPVTPKRERKS
jgi:hypothetical protein